MTAAPTDDVGRAIAWDAVGIAALTIYGVNVTVVKVALRHTGVLIFTSARWLVAGLILLTFSAIRRRPRAGPVDRVAPAGVTSGAPRRHHWGRVAVAAIVGVVINQVTFSESVRHTTATDVSLIIGATPLVVALWVSLATDEALSRTGWLVLLVGAAGLVLVVFGGDGKHGSRSLSGDLLAVAALASWAAYIVIVSRLLTIADSVRLSGTVATAGGVMLLTLAVPEFARQGIRPSLELLGLFAFSAVVATALATACYYASLRRLGAARLAAFQYLQPFVGALTAWAVLGERITPVQFIGGAIVILALWRTPRAVPAPATVDHAGADD